MEGANPELDTEGEAAVSESLDRRSEDRASSSRGQPNPFWSERASDEFRLQQARPLQLAEFDDRQVEPDYGSDTARSGGYASALELSGRAASPMPARGSGSPSEAGPSLHRSSAPSLSSRSRSPVREELHGVRELLVSLGHAVAGLAEEQRNTQRRLAVVEEGRSGSSSSMRTGREGVEAELVHVEMSELSSATQYFCIGVLSRVWYRARGQVR